jgi:segregation and condensation protein B
MEIRLEKEAALIETVLFLESEPLDEAALARITGLARDVVDRALEVLTEDYSSPARGLEPVRSGGGWILAPKSELWEVLKERYGRKNDARLSRAALETLSIIAYSQPITRAEVEAIRGVSADGMVRFLLERELIKEVGKKEAPGRPVQYGTTKEFLKYFRLGSIADLPKLDELEQERFSVPGSAPEKALDASAETPVAPVLDPAPSVVAEPGEAVTPEVVATPHSAPEVETSASPETAADPEPTAAPSPASPAAAPQVDEAGEKNVPSDV